MGKDLRKNKSIIIAIYSHPEFYPPTLNAIQELSLLYENIYVISRNVVNPEWTYPSNVNLIQSGMYLTIRESEQKNIFFKIISFINFSLCFYKLIISKKPNLIQVCDPIPLFSVFLIRGLINNKIRLWYHNHDVADVSLTRKYSIGWFAITNEAKMFPLLDIFTLPSVEREKYFPLNQLKGKYYFLPNYPSLHFYNKFISSNKKIENEIKLVYQGSIGPGHGIEEIISILAEEIQGKMLTLHLKGFISEDYKLELIRKAKVYLVENKLFFYPVTAYQDVPKLASTCHIGIGIHTGNDIMNSSLGTSSNKIYEYAALGLPVILFKNQHFYDALSEYYWTKFTNLKKCNLVNCILSISEEYSNISFEAKKSFQTKLNYEKFFQHLILEQFE